jgi:cell division protein FtsQ
VAGRPAKGGGAAILEEPREEFYRPPTGESETRARRAPRANDDEEDEEPFLRAKRRVPVRRGLLPSWARTRWGAVLFAGCVLLTLGAITALGWEARHFLRHDPRFVITSSASIQTVGNSQLTRADLLSVFGSDIGRNLFYVPLDKRRAELEQIPWVEHATVMRVLPNQLRVAVSERTPIAFVEIRGQIELADAAGVILQMSPQDMAARHYAFPVVLGINPGGPLSVRGARMQLYQRFLHDLDSGGEKVSARLSEVDLSDPDDVKATVPANGTDLLLYFGQEDFLARWQNYEAHIAQWRAQYPNLASVDLRYEREVVLKMANAPAEQNAPAPAAAKPAPAKPAKTHARPSAAQKRASKRTIAARKPRHKPHTVREAQ